MDALLRTPISPGTNAVNSTTPGSMAGASVAGLASVGTSPGGSSQAYGNPGAMAGSTQLLSNLASAHRSYMPVIVNHYNVWPVFDVFANVDRRDLGGVGAEVTKIMREEEPHLPRGTSFSLRGQVATMQSSFFRLGLGLVFAVVLVYLLMTVNFQSWLDPFIILMALPGATAGILWMLFLTGTSLSVPSLMGAMMCIGVATANSILIVTFANDERENVALRAGGHALGRLCAGAAGADDGYSHDPGHGSHVAGHRGRRRTECAIGTGGDRGTGIRHGDHAVRGPDHLFLSAHQAAGRSSA